MRDAMIAALVVVLAACEPSAPPNAPALPGPAPEPSQPAPSAGPDAGKAGDGSAKTLFVRDKLVDCEGEGPMKCMQVRASEKDEWTLFYGSIEGFEFVEGYEYELRVAHEHVDDPPMDSSSRRVRLLEIVSKKKVSK